MLGIISGLRICLLRISTAVRPISLVKTVMLESAGKTCLVKAVSLKEIKLTRLGTGMFASCKARSAPMAKLSLAIKNACGKFSLSSLMAFSSNDNQSVLKSPQ